MRTQTAIIRHGNFCYAVSKNYGNADQFKAHEYMPNVNGTFFDNSGYDRRTFSDRAELEAMLAREYAPTTLKLDFMNETRTKVEVEKFSDPGTLSWLAE